MRAFLFTALLLSAGFSWAASDKPTPSDGKQTEAKNTNPASHNQRPETNQGRSESAPLSVKIIPPQNAQPKSNGAPYEHKHEARPDWWIIVPTILLALFTLGLFFYTAKLWGATKRLVEDANIAEAPFVIPGQMHGEGFFPGSRDRPRLIYGFKNHGKSPAIIRRWRDYSLFDHNLPPAPYFEERWEGRPERYIPVPPGEEGGLLVAHVPLGITQTEVADGLKDKKKWFYVIGEVEYEDIFGTLRIQGYCLRIMHVWRDKEGMGLLDSVSVARDGGRAYNNRYEPK